MIRSRPRWFVCQPRDRWIKWRFFTEKVKLRVNYFLVTFSEISRIHR